MTGIGTSFRQMHLARKRLQPKQMILAKCAECMADYTDGGRADCNIDDCPLHPLMPYNKNKILMRHHTADSKKAKAKILMKAREVQRKKRGRASN